MGERGDKSSNFLCTEALKELQEGKWGMIFMIGWTKRQHNITTHNLHYKVHDIFKTNYKLKTRLV
jgi:hypothetical protein